jgi:hypothetical protein
MRKEVMNMCCGPSGISRAYRESHHAEACCCRPYHGFRRSFACRDERTSRMRDYLTDLREEAKAVEEELARLEKE